MTPLERDTRNVQRDRRPRRRHGEQVVYSEKASHITKPAAHRTCRAPGESAQQRRASVRRLPSRGTGSAREGRVHGPQEAAH